ncbi:MAG: hypothetical protein IT348_05305 [Candidatus Eisenbacteria bacterium]|nr:hypothetical protein [Candidatus Eisenbacteria bacterium]
MRPVFRLLPLACLLALAAGCGSTRTTSPAVPSRAARLVTVVLTDSLGRPLYGGPLRATSLTDSAGLARVVTGYAFNDSGNVRFTLSPGPWAFTGVVVSWDEPGFALGGTAVVPGDERAAGDTVLVRIEIRTASRVQGRIRLQGRADHSGTLVSLGVAETHVLTDEAGDFSLGAVPPGRWAVTAYQGGYELGVWWVSVPAPGSLLTLAEDSLAADGSGPGDPPIRMTARPLGTPPSFRILAAPN